MTSWPPRWANVSIQPAIFTRWSTDWAYPSSLPTQSIARCVGPGSCEPGAATETPSPSIFGAWDSQKFSWRSRSCWSAVWNMHCVDMTRPARISSAVRLDIRVTSYPCDWRPRASWRPDWPAPTTSIVRMRVLAPKGGLLGGLVQRVADEGQQGLDDRDLPPRVHDHDRYAPGDTERLPHVLRLEQLAVVEVVDRDDVRQSAALEVVEGGEGVLEAAGVGQD